MLNTLDFKSQLHSFPNPNITECVTLWPPTNSSAHELLILEKYAHSSYFSVGFITKQRLSKQNLTLLPGRLNGSFITKLDIYLLRLKGLTCLGCFLALAELDTGLQELSQLRPALLSLPPSFINQGWTIKMPSGSSNPPTSRQ